MLITALAAVCLVMVGIVGFLISKRRHVSVAKGEKPLQLKGGAMNAVAQTDRENDNKLFFEQTLTEAKIRPLQLSQLFPGIEHEAVEIGAIDADTEHPNHTDMLYVCAIARKIGARRIFEFGTYLGRTTYHLARGAAVERVFTLDLNPAGPYPADAKLGQAVRAVHERNLQGHFFRGTPTAERIIQLHGDSRVFDISPYRGTIDFIFVDGGHSFELISNDTALAFGMLKPGGVVVWHDFAPKGRDVVTFARELARSKSLFWIEDTSLLVYVDGLDSQTYQAPVAPYARRVLKP